MYSTHSLRPASSYEVLISIKRDNADAEWWRIVIENWASVDRARNRHYKGWIRWGVT